MKTTTLKTLALIIASFCFAGAAQSQSNTNGLQVSAQASLLLTATNSPRILLTVQLVNANDHEVTVLTRKLSVAIHAQSRDPDQLVLQMGFTDRPVMDKGHPIIPSLYDHSPVTLRPNEEAFITHEIVFGLEALAKRSDMPLIVEYSISPEWGKRFELWSGKAQSPPFTATVRK